MAGLSSGEKINGNGSLSQLLLPIGMYVYNIYSGFCFYSYFPHAFLLLIKQNIADTTVYALRIPLLNSLAFRNGQPRTYGAGHACNIYKLLHIYIIYMYIIFLKLALQPSQEA